MSGWQFPHFSPVQDSTCFSRKLCGNSTSHLYTALLFATCFQIYCNFVTLCNTLCPCYLTDIRPSSWRRQWHPTPVLLPGKSHGRRSLEGWSPWGRWGSDTTEWLHFHFSLSCTGEGNGNSLQYSCLENPRDGGAWWAAIYGVTQSRTRLKWLSSSSSRPRS